MKITFENFDMFPKGTKVEMNFGAYYATCPGVIVDWKVLPCTKWFPEQVVLIVEYEDYASGDGELITTMVDMIMIKGDQPGIGCWLIE